MSALKPQFDANNVRLVGIGLEEVGVDEFVHGNYFSGDLYIDEKKQCYKDLGFVRISFLKLLPMLFSKKSRDAMNKAKQDKLGGDLKGDGMQNGGVLVVEKGGKTLLSFKQEEPADKVNLEDVLAALGITADPSLKPPGQGQASGGDAPIQAAS